MVTEQEIEKMSSSELVAYMRGYRDGQVDMRELLCTNVNPVSTGTRAPSWTYEMGGKPITIQRLG